MVEKLLHCFCCFKRNSSFAIVHVRDIPNIRNSLMSVIFPPAILRPEMAAPILWAPGIFGSFCWKTPMPIKFLLLGGGGGMIFLLKGGWKCQFYFYGRGDFSDNMSQAWSPRQVLQSRPLRISPLFQTPKNSDPPSCLDKLQRSVRARMCACIVESCEVCFPLPMLCFPYFSETWEPPQSRRRKRWKTNGEKMVDFWCRFFHGLVPIFFTVYADFSRFVRDINGEFFFRYWWSFFHG